ncbi:MAG: chromosome segregation protein SMC, partial [Dehalococcoidia bacterium]|nr:chromosome segregation protein SMC [Dehalococcoidia bacterium]
MYLRRLEAQGFKAFADRQRFEYGPGLTVIMGPNGSGKSNVADAIRWALGESSARQVRARKTEDVIFSGSDKRRQMGAAEVSVSLDNADGWMPIEFGEVTVTRRAFRSGENEYLINGQKVRLADVQDLFRRAQVGQNSYAMMSQGLVDEVLAMRPAERRDLIEEAANVRRHRQQLTQSERRLVETRDNLGRVRMLIREVEPRIRSLQRQTARAERYQDLAARLREAQLVFYEHELRAANEALAAARARHDQHTEEFEAAQRLATEHESRLGQLSALTAERRQAFDALQARERELVEEERRLQQEVALANQRLELLTTRMGDLAAEIARLEQEPDAVDSDGDELTSLVAAVEEARNAGTRAREALQSADEAARTVLREVSEAEARRARLEAQLADARRRVTELEARRAAIEVERGKASTRREGMLSELKDLGVRARDLHTEARAIEETEVRAKERRTEAERALEEQLQQTADAREAARAAEAQLTQHDERAALLERLLGATQAGDSGTRAVIEAATGAEPSLTGVVGALTGLLRVPDGLEQAIEGALGEQLSALVVEREADALAALAHLRDSEAGTATVFALQSVGQLYPVNVFNERGVIGVAARLVRCESAHRPLVDALLGRTIVVEDLATARQMLERGLGSVVTRDGILLRPGGSYFGGKTGEVARQFSLRRELEALPGQRDALAEALEVARARLAALDGADAAARAALSEARAAADGLDGRRRKQREGSEQVRRRIATLSGDMRLVRRALREAADEEATRSAVDRREAAVVELNGVADHIGTLRDRAQAVTAERDAAAERSTAAVAALAAAEGAHRSAVTRRAEREAAIRRAREQLDAARARLAATKQESEDVTLASQAAAERLGTTTEARTQVSASIDPHREALAAAVRDERALQEQRQAAQQRHFAAERAMLESDNALRQALSQLSRVNEQLQDDGFEVDAHGLVRPAAPPPADAVDAANAVEGTPAEDARAEDGDGDASDADRLAAAALLPVRGGTTVDLATLREEIAKLRGDIRGLGPVNVDALEELTEERQRYEFLSSQVADLEAAEVELREAIGDLRKLIAERFDETFAAVNTAFVDYFAKFFGGGVAELKLLTEQGDEEPGVEISAQPPGKRIASLNVLS